MPKGIYDHSKNRGTTGLHWKVQDSSKMKGRHPTSEFKVGAIPWNKGTTGLMVEPWNKDRQGVMTAWNKGKHVPQMAGENNPAWKGDMVSYRTLHNWVNRHAGKATHCELDSSHKATYYHWANISGEYKRDLSDWMQLCPRCNLTDGVKMAPRFKEVAHYVS